MTKEQLTLKRRKISEALNASGAIEFFTQDIDPQPPEDGDQGTHGNTGEDPQ